MKKLFLFILLFVPLLVQAYDAKIDGIYYEFHGDEATVTGKGLSEKDDDYSGDVSIPSSVVYNGKTYSVTSIGTAFYGCSNITSVTIPNSVTGIQALAFVDCSNLTSVTIPNSVTNIESAAFMRCSSLSSVTIPSSVNSIGVAFYECSNLKTVTILPKWLIGYNFSQEVNLGTMFGSQVEQYILSEDASSIGSYAFYGCSTLKTISIPNSVTDIGNCAFYGCSGLSSMTIPNSVTKIGYSAYNKCSGLTSISIPNSVTNIGTSAFAGCSNLTSICIPNSVTSIGAYAFSGCSSITSVTIPNSVTNLGEEPFSGCSNLTSLINLSKVPQSCYLNLPTTCTVHVIRGYKDVYKKSATWFSCNIVEDIDEEIRVSSISLSETFLEVKLGDEFGLTATVLPDDAENKEVEWTSSNPNVVFPIGETWYASGEGTATITATAKDGSGVSASCTVTVVSEEEPFGPEDVTDIATLDNALYIDPITTLLESQVVVPLNLKNKGEIIGYQCDILLPEGVEFMKDAKGKYICKVTDRCDDHIITTNLLDDGSLRMMCVSLSNTAFENKDGGIANITIDVSKDMEVGTYPIHIKNAILSTSNKEKLQLPETISSITVEDYTLGDVNNDGSIDVVDVTMTIAAALGDKLNNFNRKAADVNGDGTIDVVDVTMIISMAM